MQIAFSQKNLHLRKKGAREEAKSSEASTSNLKINSLVPTTLNFALQNIIVYFFLTAKIAESWF
jgi:hypothetical protein